MPLAVFPANAPCFTMPSLPAPACFDAPVFFVPGCLEVLPGNSAFVPPVCLPWFSGFSSSFLVTCNVYVLASPFSAVTMIEIVVFSTGSLTETAFDLYIMPFTLTEAVLSFTFGVILRTDVLFGTVTLYEVLDD